MHDPRQERPPTESAARTSAGLHMSAPTVKTRVSRILGKPGLNSRVQITLPVRDAAFPPGR